MVINKWTNLRFTYFLQLIFALFSTRAGYENKSLVELVCLQYLIVTAVAKIGDEPVNKTLGFRYQL